MRTLEFRAYPTAEQSHRLAAWLELHRRIWNYGLAMLLELADFSAYDKASKTRVPCCPLPWSDRWQKAEEGGAWQAIPYSQIRRHRDGWSCCPLPQDHRPPRLGGDSFMAIAAFFAKRNHPNWPELKDCPVPVIRGTVQTLATAWSEYRSGKRDAMGRTRKVPRFKGERFPIKTLTDPDCKKTARVEGDLVTLPKLGTLRIKGNRDGRRWPADRVVCTYRLQKEPSGWYLLLVGEVPAPAVRPTTLAVGLDAGVVHTLTTSTGRYIESPRALEASLRKLERLQQQMARQTKGGANWKKTAAKVARLHERIRRTRKHFAHKVSTFTLRTYGTVAVEKLNHDGMARRPAPKPAEDGSGAFLPNQAAAKGVLNRRLRDAGLGQIKTMLEAKAAERGRVVIAVDPRHTSQMCSACGHIAPENRPDQATFCCTACGFELNADHNAARTILKRAREG
ncbi:MAG: RNA-guided endonuclease TnpB family protein [Cyanobium sp.]